jgi:hypothetical protein
VAKVSTAWASKNQQTASADITVCYMALVEHNEDCDKCNDL